jgi:hypothetical protein
VEISFNNKELAKLCCSTKEMQAKHGKRMAEKIQQRLAELQAAESLAYFTQDYNHARSKDQSTNSL